MSRHDFDPELHRPQEWPSPKGLMNNERMTARWMAGGWYRALDKYDKEAERRELLAKNRRLALRLYRVLSRLCLKRFHRASNRYARLIRKAKKEELFTFAEYEFWMVRDLHDLGCAMIVQERRKIIQNLQSGPWDPTKRTRLPSLPKE